MGYCQNLICDLFDKPDFNYDDNNINIEIQSEIDALYLYCNVVDASVMSAIWHDDIYVNVCTLVWEVEHCS